MRTLSICLCLLLWVGSRVEAQPLWSYVVNASADGSTLDVQATLASPGTSELSVNDGAEAFLTNVQVRHGEQWQDVAVKGTSWFVPQKGTLAMRYHFELHKAAMARRHRTSTGPTIVSPGGFLLRPVRGPAGTVRFTFLVAPPLHFACGYREVKPNTWEAQADDLFMGPDAVLGELSTMPMDIPGAHLVIAYVPGALKMTDAELKSWMHDKLMAVAAYFGKLPLPEGIIIALPIDGADIHGETRGGSGFSVRMGVGRSVTLADAMADWTFTHEMVHVCTPSVPSPQHWMEEGIATYLEPVIRARVGDLTAEKVWHDMIEGMPQGQPGAGDGGLNGTDAWGRTYWGGATFWLLADVQIRLRTHNHKSLRDALMGMIGRGASVAAEWKPEQVLEAGDAATGTRVLHEFYASMGEKPHKVDLDTLWKQLGVRQEGDTAAFFAAPQSAIREAITAPK